jgi:hypothetical protein
MRHTSSWPRKQPFVNDTASRSRNASWAIVVSSMSNPAGERRLDPHRLVRVGRDLVRARVHQLAHDRVDRGGFAENLDSWRVLPVDPHRDRTPGLEHLRVQLNRVGTAERGRDRRRPTDPRSRPSPES